MRRGWLIAGGVVALAGFVPWSMWTPSGYALAGAPVLATAAPWVLPQDQVSAATKLAMLVQANSVCTALGVDGERINRDAQGYAGGQPSLKHALLTSNIKSELTQSQAAGLAAYCQSVATRLGTELAPYQRRS